MSISLSDLLIDATRIPARKLLRDYYELESLQNTGKHNDDFAAQSLKRMKENIAIELLKHKITSNFFFKDEAKPSGDFYIYVVPIDSLSSFARAKPSFGTMATLFKNNEAQMSVIHFPSTKEILYAEIGRGLWVEKLNRNSNDPIKIRSSNISDISKGSIVSDNVISLFEYEDYFKSFKNIEIINSPLYNVYQVCHGIADVSIISIDCSFFLQSLNLICTEAKTILKTFFNDKKAIIANLKIQMPKSN